MGANLIGALGGGLLEPLAFVFGQKSLLVPAALFYGLVWVLNRKRLKGQRLSTL